ncbi:MAG: ATP-dependent 6-phosphofructokinase [Planctomycetota bacterium]
MKIGVFCSGGDAPGMNACVRAVVRRAISEGHEVVGINRGYQGLLDETFFINEANEPLMSLRSVSGWSRFGGAFLRSSRSAEFCSEAGVKKAAAILEKHGIDALIPIGGDGTFHGAVDLARCWDGRIVGCPGTIDNDLMGTDFTIGFSTAVQTAVEAVDKIRDTAESHERMFLVEVMGRHSGFIAAHTALAASAECVCIPETTTDVQGIVRDLHEMKARGKGSVMMIVSEGDEEGDAIRLNELLLAAGNPYSTRCVILGHLQRGGSPSPEDRILASSVGDFAVQAILEGQTGVMAGVIGGQPTLTRFEDTYAQHKSIPPELSSLIERLAR